MSATRPLRGCGRPCGLVKGIVEGDMVFEQEAPPAVEGLAPGEAPPGVEELAPEGDPPGEQLGLFGSG